MDVDMHVPGSLGVVREDGTNGRHPLPEEMGDLRGRRVKLVPEPEKNKPTDAQFFLPSNPSMPNPAFLQSHFIREGRLTEAQALFILEHATSMLKQEPNIVEVRSPVTICGDIHGQYYDLMKLFEVGGGVENNTYLFLGDYVDRGSFGIECLLLLYTLKLNYPTKFVLLRGNHECRHLTEYFTFKRECLHKYSPRVYEACIESFCALPVAARVDRHFFCVHGGISPSLQTLDDIRRMHRFQEPGSSGLLCDLLWSDPIPTYGQETQPSPMFPQPLGAHVEFVPNPTRGCSYYFTYAGACAFLERNNLLGIIRGHEAQDAGYLIHKKTEKRFPSVITIFSAPNYLDVYHNRGAVLKYQNKNVTIRQYNSSTHPYWLPNFMDAFTWSLPFVGAKITEMLLAILSICSEEELGEDTGDAASDDDDTRTLAGAAGAMVTAEEYQQRRQQIKNKIMAVGKMQRVFQLLREEAEAASELDDVDDPAGLSTIGARLGPDALGVQGTNITRHIHSFDDARRSDLMNERLPDLPQHSPTMFPTPSMRLQHRKSPGLGPTQSPSGLDMEFLIRRTLEEQDGGDENSLVERLADRIARGRKPTGRPQPLKRFDTT